MEETSPLSSKDVTVENRQQPSPPPPPAVHPVRYPSFLHEALRALLKCLGFETPENQPNKPACSCPLRTHDNGGSSVSGGGGSPDPPSTSTATTADDPPSTTTEDPAGDSVATVLAVPARPGLSTGSGGRIN